VDFQMFEQESISVVHHVMFYDRTLAAAAAAAGAAAAAAAEAVSDNFAVDVAEVERLPEGSGKRH
jgi:hypothetical protein